MGWGAPTKSPQKTVRVHQRALVVVLELACVVVCWPVPQAVGNARHATADVSRSKKETLQQLSQLIRAAITPDPSLVAQDDV